METNGVTNNSATDEYRYVFRKKSYTYDEFVNGPGKNMSTDELQKTLDHLSGATRSRRALLRFMTTLGYKKEDGENGQILSFSGNGETLTFQTYGDLERFLIKNGTLKDDKKEEEIRAQKEKEKAKKVKEAQKVAKQKEVQKEKEKEKRERERARARARAEAIKQKEKEKKEAAKKKAALKKENAAKTTAAKKAAAKRVQRAKSTPSDKEVVAKRGPGRPKKSETLAVSLKKEAKTTKKQSVRARGRKASSSKISLTVSKNLSENGFVLKVGQKEYTLTRLRNLAMDSYVYDLGGDKKDVKSLDVYVTADQRKCQFIVNGKVTGDITL